MAVDIFLKLDGIKGEAEDAKHKESIDVLSFSWGANQTGIMGFGGGGGAGKVQMHDVSISKRVDSASPALFLHCCNGKHIANGLLTVRKAGEDPLEYLKIKMEDIIITSVTESGNGHDELAMEQVTLNFSKIFMTYTPQGKKGTAGGGGIEGNWDVKKNVKA